MQPWKIEKLVIISAHILSHEVILTDTPKYWFVTEKELHISAERLLI